MMLWIAIGAFWAGCLGGGWWPAQRAAAIGGAEPGKVPERRRRGRLTMRGYPLVVVAVVLAVPLLLVTEGETGGEGSNGVDPLRIVVVAGSVALVGFALVVVGRNLAGHDPDAGRIARRLSADQASQRLLTRWMQRVRWRRWLGGFLGLLLGVLLLDNGTGWDRVVVLGLVGVMAGSLSAELHHLRPSGGDRARVADLTNRRFADYTVRSEELTLGAVAAGAGATLVVGLVGSSPAGGWWAGAALGVVALVLGLQWRVVGRRRPALPPELRQADDLMRRLAVSRGVARPGLALAFALLGQALEATGAGALATLCWLAALATWWLSRRLGLDHLLRQPVAVA